MSRSTGGARCTARQRSPSRPGLRLRKSQIQRKKRDSALRTVPGLPRLDSARNKIVKKIPVAQCALFRMSRMALIWS